MFFNILKKKRPQIRKQENKKEVTLQLNLVLFYGQARSKSSLSKVSIVLLSSHFLSCIVLFLSGLNKLL